MSRLDALHRSIGQARRRRRLIGLGTGAALFAGVVLAALFVALCLDVGLRLGVIERVLMLAALALVAVWAARRFLLPAFRRGATPLETAMQVERRHGLQSDLVAGLQFDDDNRPQYGSGELRQAAVERAAEAAGEVDVFRGLSSRRLLHAGVFALAAFALLAVPTLVMGYGPAFLNRLLLGDAHYPTRTQIEEVTLPGDRVPAGMPVPFEIRAGGELPPGGEVRVTTSQKGLGTAVALAPRADDPGVYTGQLPVVRAPFRYTVELGDAYTDPLEVALVPRPVAEIDFRITTPAYAAARFEGRGRSGRSRRLALQGSRVVPVITCSNKTLRSARMVVEDEPLAFREDKGRFVPAATNTVFDPIDATVRWRVEVEDEDGLGLERPLEGTLQVRPDQPPQIGIASASRLVWSGARPAIHYRAIDDFAMARVLAHLSVQRASGLDTNALEVLVVEPAAPRPDLAGTHALDLGPFKLGKGDRLMVQFEAIDHRGDLPGRSQRSETLVLDVSDRDTVLQTLRELDTEMDRKLQQIINAQIGI